MIDAFCRRIESFREIHSIALWTMLFLITIIIKQLSSNYFEKEAVFLKEPKVLFRPPGTIKAILSRNIYLLGQADPCNFHLSLAQISFNLLSTLDDECFIFILALSCFLEVMALPVQILIHRYPYQQTLWHSLDLISRGSANESMLKTAT
jgi:hypothetical protein